MWSEVTKNKTNYTKASKIKSDYSTSPAFDNAIQLKDSVLLSSLTDTLYGGISGSFIDNKSKTAYSE